MAGVVQNPVSHDYHDEESQCSSRSRDVAGQLPSASSISNCPCGITNGNVLTVCRVRPDAKRFPFVMMLGPDWPCLAVTYTLTVGAWIAFLVLVAPKLHAGVVAAGVVLAVATVAALSITACSDPGIVPKQELRTVERQREKWDAALARWREAQAAGSGVEPGTYVMGYRQPVPDRDDVPSDLRDENGAMLPELNRMSLCGMCHVYRPSGTAHCYDCNACIAGLDHHCPWTGKCIGKENLRPFYAFLWTVTGSIIYVLACLFAWILGRVANV